MTSTFIENPKDKEALQSCKACEELELNIQKGISSDVFDSENVIFVSSEVKATSLYQYADGESTQVMVLRFLQLIEFKVAEEQYSIMKTLNLDRNGKLRLLYIKKSSRFEGGATFMRGLQDALVPYSLYLFAGDFSISDTPFSQRHFTNEPMITVVPKIVHLHHNSTDPEFPLWAKIHLDSTSQIAKDSMNFISHKTYSMLGILKYIEVRVLPNYLNEQQNSEAYLILTDEHLQEFEVHVWGSAKKFSTFELRDIIFLSNFKIDRLGKTGTVELRSIGFSDIIKDPYFIDPDAIEKLQQMIPHCFISTVEQLPYFQQNIRLVLLNCFIQSAEFVGNAAYVLFVDFHNNLFRAAIRNHDIIDKLKSENLELYHQIPFNLLLRVNPQVSLIPFSHMNELEVDYFN